jgi:1-acyl-sn-glycerol-3-phosphate acyltransferase
LFPRKLDVVASEDAFRNKLQTFGMKFWGGIKCDRRVKSMRFIPESVKRIQRGRIVQIFPEGHNTPDGTIKEFYGSYILIALRANCPIIPIVSDGNYGLFKRLHVIIGKKIWLRDYLDHEKYTKEDILRLNDMVRNHVLELRQELDRRVEADRRRKKGER